MRPLRLLADTNKKVPEMSEMNVMKSWPPDCSARGVVVIDKKGKIAYIKVQTLSLFTPSNEEVLSAISTVE